MAVLTKINVSSDMAPNRMVKLSTFRRKVPPTFSGLIKNSGWSEDGDGKLMRNADKVPIYRSTRRLVNNE